MQPVPHQDFNTNVFINCPFDSEYDSLLKPILFTIIYFGFTPQIASRTGDSGEQRITKILSLILKSKYSIHDLSRIKSAKRGEFYRLNMPFEFGIDYGCRCTAKGQLKRKKFLVLGESLTTTRTLFQSSLSLRSRRKHKAWGTSPRIIINLNPEPMKWATARRPQFG